MALKIKVTSMRPYDGGQTQAFFDISVGSAGRTFFFNDLTLVKKKDGSGLFVGIPSRPGKTEGEYFRYFNFDKKTKVEVETVAIAEYKKKSPAPTGN